MIYKNRDIEAVINERGVNLGNIDVVFYTKDINTTSFRLFLKKKIEYANETFYDVFDLRNKGLTPYIDLMMEDGSIFTREPMEIVEADAGLIQYNIPSDILLHVGKVEASVYLLSDTNKEDEGVEVAQFYFYIDDDGLTTRVRRVVNTHIVDEAVARVLSQDAQKLLDSRYKTNLENSLRSYLFENADRFKGPKGDEGDVGNRGPKGDKGEQGLQGLDGKSLTYESLTQTQKDELKSNITNQAVTDFVIEDNSITSSKIADKTISYSKLSETFAGGPRIFNSDNLNILTKEGVYFKFSGANPTGLPSELIGEECFIEVRAWYATSTSNYVIQTITSNNSLNKIYRRVVKGGTTPRNFSVYDLTDKGHIVAKKTLESTDLNDVVEDGYFLGLSTNTYKNMPAELEKSSFLLRVESFASHQGFVIQTIYQTSGRIDIAFKRFIQVKVNETNIVGEWFKDTSLTGGHLVDTTGSRYPALAGKNIVHFGDSLTEFGKYHDILKDMSSANTTKIGFGGCRMANVPSTHFRYKYNQMSMVSISESIKNKDFTELEKAANNLKTNDNDDNTQQVKDLKNIDFNKVDYITILFGTNDYTSLVPLGEKESTNVEEFNGAINKVVENILATYPHIKILFLTPTWRARMDNGDGKESDKNPNKNGDYLINYVDAIIERADNYKLNKVDLYRNSGINKFTTAHYQVDGLHLTEAGDQLLARVIGNNLSRF